MFVDETKIMVSSGCGGDGCVSFLREKYRPFGGPDGGNGGNGGDVIIEASKDISTLFEISRRREYRADNGRPGQGKACSGHAAKNLILFVPCGTVIKDLATGEVLGDLVEHGHQYLAAPGGKGGRGNKSYASPTNQTPREHELGGKGVQVAVSLELKLIADAGFIGLPNAGKSTLLSRVSAAHPKIASYPFTTLEPHLGIASIDVGRQIVFADIPGLIEGAHKGVGLGDKFLKHVERTKILVHLVDLAPYDGSDPEQNYHIVNRELHEYSEELSKKAQIVVATKLDLPEAQARMKAFAKSVGVNVMGISAVSGKGLRELMEHVYSVLHPTGD